MRPVALSNWDTLAFDQEGPCGGAVTNHLGATVEIYKNWVYLRKGDSVAKLDQGKLSWEAWDIEARRGPQDGVYVIAHSSQWMKDKRAEERLLVGCGVYGFDDPADEYADRIAELGGDYADMDQLVCMVSRMEDGTWVNELEFFREDGERVVIATDVRDPEWVGVTPESLTFLQDMVASSGHMKPVGRFDPRTIWPGSGLAVIDWGAAQRQNQGDVFLADQLGLGSFATSPGDAEAPLLMQALEQHPED